MIKETVNPNDTILIQIPIDDNGDYCVDMDETLRVYEDAKKFYPNNPIIVLPNRFDFKAVDKTYLKNHVLEMLDKVNTPEYKDNCNFYKGEINELFNITEKYPISMYEIVDIIKTAIPLIECGTSSLVYLVLEREKYRRQLNKGEIE